MTVLLSHLWPALALAAGLGLVFAAVFGPGRGLPSVTLPVRIGTVLALAAAALVSGLSLVPGRPGLWFDIVVLTVWAYAIGVLIGTLLRRVVVGSSRRRSREETIAPASARTG